MYFVNLLPAIAYTLDMYRRTGEFFGVNEALFSSALAAVVFSTLSAQPLTIVGVTGLISLFNFTIYDIIKIYDISIYPQFMAWTGIWAAIFHWLVAVFNGCDYMRYVTDFSSESFGLYVGIIYIIKGVEELVNEFITEGSAAGYLACLIAILYFGTVYALEKLGSSTLWRAGFRGILADYAYVFATVFWVGFSHIPGPLKDAHIMRVPIEAAFHPTQPRNWLIDFWNLDFKWVFVAMPFGFLTMLLFYYDHNVSTLILLGRRVELLEQVAKSIHEKGLDTETACYAVDVCDEHVVKSTLNQIVFKFGRIDIVIHAAGALPPLGPLATVPLDNLWRAFEVNIKGFLILAQAMLAVTTSDQDRSSQPVLIVLNTAGSIMPPLPGMGGYVASKMSSLKLAEYLASENKDKLRVISVHPGLILTPMAEELEKTGLKFPYDDISLPADFLVWAASQEAAFLNGKFVFANWDVEELKASAGKIEGGADLSLMLRGL
ncbi:putative transporter [Colletotrichum sp. SAR 10_98]|nr:putative transporter [Colletotrichum sp. SAR 10_96]KAI8288037.1 putative transporter [Colletotrichum sp. SAR 10_98]